jgi:hypothetical protein
LQCQILLQRKMTVFYHLCKYFLYYLDEDTLAISSADK